jgi:hypothetical protein
MKRRTEQRVRSRQLQTLYRLSGSPSFKRSLEAIQMKRRMSEESRSGTVRGANWRKNRQHKELNRPSD